MATSRIADAATKSVAGRRILAEPMDGIPQNRELHGGRVRRAEAADFGVRGGTLLRSEAESSDQTGGLRMLGGSLDVRPEARAVEVVDDSVRRAAPRDASVPTGVAALRSDPSVSPSADDGYAEHRSCLAQGGKRWKNTGLGRIPIVSALALSNPPIETRTQLRKQNTEGVIGSEGGHDSGLESLSEVVVCGGLEEGSDLLGASVHGTKQSIDTRNATPCEVRAQLAWARKHDECAADAAGGR